MTHATTPPTLDPALPSAVPGRRQLAVALLLALVLALLLDPVAAHAQSVAPATGATDFNGIGDNLSNSVSSWAKGLLLAVAGAMSIGAIIRQSWVALMSIVGIALGGGLFVFNDGAGAKALVNAFATLIGK